MTIWRYWTPAGEAPPYSGWIGSVIDGLSGPAQRIEFAGLDLPPQLVAILPRILAAADPHQARVHTANLVRWAILLERGGVWLDHDVIPLVDVTTIPRPWCATIGAEFVSCAIGLDAGDPLAGAMLAAGVEWGPFGEGDQAAIASGDGLLNGWAAPHRSAETKRLARHHLNPVPLPFDAEGFPVPPFVVPVGGRSAWAMVHLWHHREASEKRNA